MLDCLPSLAVRSRAAAKTYFPNGYVRRPPSTLPRAREELLTPAHFPANSAALCLPGLYSPCHLPCGAPGLSTSGVTSAA